MILLLRESTGRRSLQKTKKALADAPHLAHPNENVHLELLCDASDFSIGLVLQQKVDDEIQHLCYFSRSPKGPELSYSVYGKEMFRVFASVKYFKHMQLGKKFVILSDHRPLVNAIKNPSPNHSPKQVRRLCYILQYDCDMQYLPGSQTTSADCLSGIAINHLIADKELPFTLQELAKEQSLDPSCLDMHETTSITIEQVDIPNSPHKLHVDTSTGIQRPIVPSSLQTQLIDHYHNLAYTGINATQKMISSRYVFVNMHEIIQARVRCCIGC